MRGKNKSTEKIDTRRIASAMEAMVQMSSSMRQSFERKWYDKNFFDDGAHFRYVSRETGRIIDLEDSKRLNIPTRCIPKANRQIRGVANLLLQPDYVPVIYPEKTLKANFQNEQEYEQVRDINKDKAIKVGHWMEDEWYKQNLIIKLMQMVILAAKNSVSYLQVWEDPLKEKIKTQVFDAFEIYLMGNLTDVEDSPYIIKTTPMLMKEIEANERFDKEQIGKVIADNKFAQSQVKEGYMMSKYGTGTTQDQGSTSILKEGFIKEYLGDNNWNEVIKLGEENGAMEGKDKGDMVMRHTFEINGIWLLDEYVNLSSYPIVDFRFEPGPIYQPAFIEKFIPANKSLDMVMSRIERIIGTMAVGVYQKMKGENFEITNKAGGQIIEYTTRPLEQMNMAGLPPHIFAYIDQLNRIIEEQGASTSALGNLPAGVKSGVAIESVKQSEYANLKIASNMLKDTVKRISQKMIEIAANSYMNPQEVSRIEKDEPEYFDVIGERGVKALEDINEKAEDSFAMPDAIVLKKDMEVRIEVESGLGFTIEGKKATMQQIIDYVSRLAEQGLIGTDALKEITREFLKVYQFGSTAEFMQAFDKGLQTNQLSEDQQNQMKIAMAQVLQDTGMVGPKKEDEDIEKSKIGAAEAITDIDKTKGGK